MSEENIEKEGCIKVSGRKSKRCKKKNGNKTETTKEQQKKDEVEEKIENTW